METKKAILIQPHDVETGDRSGYLAIVSGSGIQAMFHKENDGYCHNETINNTANWETYVHKFFEACGAFEDWEIGDTEYLEEGFLATCQEFDWQTFNFYQKMIRIHMLKQSPIKMKGVA